MKQRPFLGTSCIRLTKAFPYGRFTRRDKAIRKRKNVNQKPKTEILHFRKVKLPKSRRVNRPCGKKKHMKNDHFRKFYEDLEEKLRKEYGADYLTDDAAKIHRANRLGYELAKSGETFTGLEMQTLLHMALYG